MRAAAYTRISNDPTGREAGVRRQRDDCVALVNERDWELVGVWTDNDRSASDRRKPREEFNFLLKEIEVGRIDVVVVWHVDRLYRRPAELEQLIEMVEDGRLSGGIATVTAGEIDLNTASGRLIARQLVTVGKHEVERTQERLIAMNAQAAKAGRRVGGRRAFGYETDGKKIQAEEAAEWRAMAEAVLAGASLRSIAHDLNDRGVRTAGGGDWSTSRVRDSLRNPRYAALRTYHGDVIAEADWPPLIERTSWERLQAVLTDPARRTSPGPQPRHLLAGKAGCGECGARLRSRTNHGKPAYGCASVADGGCGSVTIAADPVEEMVRAALLEFVNSPEVAESIDEAQRERAGDEQLVEEIRGLEARLDDAAGAFAEGEISRRQLVTVTQRLNAKLARLRSDLMAPRQVHIAVPEEAERLWDESLEFRRELVDAAIERVVVSKARARGMHADNVERVRIEWR